MSVEKKCDDLIKCGYWCVLFLNEFYLLVKWIMKEIVIVEIWIVNQQMRYSVEKKAALYYITI